MNTFLYLEDDEDDMFLFDKALNEINGACNVLYASTCFDLLNILKTETPDIIFLDINIPEASGIECLQKIRSLAQWQNIPIVMYSTHLHPNWIAEASLQKADLYIQKPEQFDQIKATLKSLLENNWDHSDGTRSFRVIV